jgi:hypothetical protein
MEITSPQPSESPDYRARRLFAFDGRSGKKGFRSAPSCARAPTQAASNNPQPDLAEGLGQIEIKPETIRMVVPGNGRTRR